MAYRRNEPEAGQSDFREVPFRGVELSVPTAPFGHVHLAPSAPSFEGTSELAGIDGSFALLSMYSRIGADMYDGRPTMAIPRPPPYGNISDAEFYDPPPTYEQAMVGVMPNNMSHLGSYEPAPAPPLSRNPVLYSSVVHCPEQVRVPRKLSIYKNRSVRPSEQDDNFNVADTVTRLTLYNIHRWENISMGKENVRLSVELTDANCDDVLYRWETPPGFTSCVCCCTKCLPKHDNHPPDFSLRIESASGSVEGYLKLMDKFIHVFDSSGKELSKICCKPLAGTKPPKHEISLANSSSSTWVEGYSVIENSESGRVQLPPTYSDSHDLLLLAGIFTLHFVKFERYCHLRESVADRFLPSRWR